MSRSLVAWICASLLLGCLPFVSIAWGEDDDDANTSVKSRETPKVTDDDDADDDDDDDDDDDPTEAIEESLTRQVTFEFEGTPLREVCQFIAESQKIRVVLDDRSLDEIGVSPDHAVSLRVQGIKLESALRLMLQPLGLDFAIRDEVLSITSREGTSAVVTIKVYPVAELIGPGVDGSAEGDFRSLIRTIQATVDPSSWQEVGGPGVLVAHERSRSLVCLQNRFTHQKIEQLLDELRDACEQLHVAAADSDPERLVLKVYRLTELSVEGVLVAAPKVAEGASADNLAEQFADAISETVAPESWKEAGGQGTIAATRGALFVRQTRSIHNQIRAALQAATPEVPRILVPQGVNASLNP